MKKIKMFITLVCTCMLISAPTVLAAEESGKNIPEEAVTAETEENNEDIQEEIVAVEAEESSEDIQEEIVAAGAEENSENIQEETAEAETEEEENSPLLEEYLTYYGDCAFDDVKTYNFTVDYSATPNVSVAIVRTGAGNIVARIYDENGKMINFAVSAQNYNGVVTGKTWVNLPKPEGVEGQCTFTATISSATNSSFVFSVGKNENLPQLLSGEDKVTPVAKYVGHYQGGANNSIASEKYIPGTEHKDYYEYVATNRNIIEVTSLDRSIDFDVIKGEETIYQTVDQDKTIERHSPTLVTYHTRYDGAEMEIGETYQIAVYSKTGVQLGKRYNLFVGNPNFQTGMTKSNIAATNSGTITSTKDTIFTFNVKGEPGTALAKKLYLYVGTSSYIGKYTLTSPNGQTYSALPVSSGVYRPYIDIPCDLLNYDSVQNATVNGTWILRLRSSGGSYYVTPKLGIDYMFQSGKGNIN